MSRVNDEKRNPLLAAVREGRLNKTIMSRAAGELVQQGDLSLRKLEIDGQRDYGTREEVGCIEDRLSDGRWKAYTVAEYGGSTLEVVKADRAHLLPELKYQMAVRLCQAGHFNAWNEALRHVLDNLDFKVLEAFVGKVR